MEEPSILAASAMEGSRTALDETVMPPPSTPRGVKRKQPMDKEGPIPVSTKPGAPPPASGVYWKRELREMLLEITIYGYSFLYLS